MESVEVPNDKKVEQPTSSLLAGRARFVLLLVPYAVINLVFALRLSALMASHTVSGYLFDAIAFEACFLASLIPLWMCLVPKKTGNQEVRIRKNLPNQVCFLVIMLLLAMMQFSSVTQVYDRLRAR